MPHPNRQQSLLLSQLPPTIPVQQPPPPPPAEQKKKDKKKVFLCSPCGTHYENWNLFKHMREVHKKYICLYCLGIFQSAERLVSHLEAKHQIRKKHVASIEEYQPEGPLYLMCARCEHIFEKVTTADGDAIAHHDCANYADKCDNCGGIKQSKHKCEKKQEQHVENNALSNGDSNRRVPNKKAKLSQPDLSMPPQPANQFHFGPSILQSQLMKPIEQPAQPFPIQPTTTTLSTIPASLLNVAEAPTELPPVPELPPQPVVEEQPESRPLLVPKLKVKIPKQFCTPIESEESSTESDCDEEEEEEEEEEQEQEEEEVRFK